MSVLAETQTKNLGVMLNFFLIQINQQAYLQNISHSIISFPLLACHLNQPSSCLDHCKILISQFSPMPSFNLYSPQEAEQCYSICQTMSHTCLETLQWLPTVRRITSKCVALRARPCRVSLASQPGLIPNSLCPCSCLLVSLGISNTSSFSPHSFLPTFLSFGMLFPQLFLCDSFSFHRSQL